MTHKIALCSIFLSLFLANAVAKPIHFERGLVTSAHPDATNAGVSILKKGGNAVDAAIATTLALSVVEPFSAGIGGGGFLLFYQASKNKMAALDFREVAPKLSSSDMFSDEEKQKNPKKSSTEGPFSVAVPGTIAGLAEAHRVHGKLPWRRLFEPAIHLAKNGFLVYDSFQKTFSAKETELKAYPASWSAFSQNGKTPVLGTLLKQPDLARTLEVLSRNPRDFYEGSIAKAIVTEMVKNGGLLSESDLKNYKAKWRDPLCGNFLQTQICSMPPPSSGGVLLLQMLHGVEEIGKDKLPWHEPATIDLLAKLMKRSFQDRAQLLGDPAFVDIDSQNLASRSYAKEVSGVAPAKMHESEETTHLNVVDSNHNAVSLTFTVNLGFGSGIVVPKTGILLNNEMDDFASQPNTPNAFGLVGGKANAIAPGKIPLSSMTPVIALKDNRFFFAVGSPGGSRIITTVFLTILNQMLYDMNVDQAISSGRFHHQWAPDEISMETFAFDPATIVQLKEMKNKITTRAAWSNASMIIASPQGGFDGAADPRGHGSAGGY